MRTGSGDDVTDAPQTLTLHVGEMSCDNCAAAIARRLDELDGVLESRVSYALEEASVRFSPSALSPSAIVEAIEVAARETDLSAIRLNAQIQALRFYEKLGFVADGDVFIEAGIDHRQMTKRLI